MTANWNRLAKGQSTAIIATKWPRGKKAKPVPTPAEQTSRPLGQLVDGFEKTGMSPLGFAALLIEFAAERDCWSFLT